MTAEIIILNRSAVAMAADSAVTISTPTGPKIYDSVNKLFALVKQRPVGIMIYDAADLLGLPWETIIKAYRMHHRGKPLDHLEDYAADFLQFITGTPEVMTRDMRDRYLDEAVERRLIGTRLRVDQEVDRLTKSRSRIGQRAIRKLIDAAIDVEEENWSKAQPGAWASLLDVRNIDSAHRARFDVLLAGVFQRLPIIARQSKRLRTLIYDSLTKRPYRSEVLRGSMDPRSGLVIAGFGETEYFPQYISYGIDGIVGDQLRLTLLERAAISPDTSAIIAPFAQRDMVDSFVTGITPSLQHSMTGYWRSMDQTFPDGILQLLHQAAPGLDQSVVEGLRGPIGSLVQAMVRELENHMESVKSDQVDPILNSVTYLPKDELAAMAESLVNLTSLKQRVSIDDPQTVGGPVDVAVISRGDGLVWIKRKHYFESELNPSWPITHADA